MHRTWFNHENLVVGDIRHYTHQGEFDSAQQPTLNTPQPANHKVANQFNEMAVNFLKYPDVARVPMDAFSSARGTRKRARGAEIFFLSNRRF